jgi:hypothetical protein
MKRTMALLAALMCGAIGYAYAADVKISDLPAATTPLAGTETVPCVQGGTTKKCTLGSASGLTAPIAADELTLCCHTESSVSGTVTMTNADCGTAYLGSNVAVTTIVLPASPSLECQSILFIGTGGESFPSYIDFNGKALAAYGPGGHDMPTAKFINSKFGSFIWVGYDGTKWTVRNCVATCQHSLTEHLPMTANGQVYLDYDGSQFFRLTPYNGPGWIIANGYSHRILAAGLKIDKVNTSNNNTNYIYLDDCGHANVTAIADNGSGKARLTTTACGNTGDQVQAFIYGVPLSMTPLANGIKRATVIDATHIDLPDVTFVSGGSFSGGARILALQFSTTGPSQGTDLNGTVQETTVSSQWAIVGQTVIGAAHSVTSTRSWFNSAVAFTGAAKSFADGSFGPAASTDLSDTASVARSTNNLSFFSSTTSAQMRTLLSDESGNGAELFANGALGTPASGDLSNTTNIPAAQLSGVVPAANGGAGTINGALKANGSGTVSAADCASLSDDGTACTAATGTSGHTLGYLDGANTYSAAQVFQKANTNPAGNTGSGTFLPMGVVFSITASAATLTGTGEQTLGTYTLPANSLDVAGRNLRINACFKHAANSNTATSRLYFGAEVITDGGVASSGTVTCEWMTVLKTGSNTQNVVAGGVKGGISPALLAQLYTAAGETDTAGIVIKATGQDTTSSANDDTLVSFTVEYMN